MTNLQEHLSRFADSDFLQQTLETSMGAAGEGVAVTFFYKGEVYSASINEFTPHDSVQIGCVAKSLTASLLALAQMEGRLQLDASIADYLLNAAISEPLKTHLQATKIYHLLNHSNGFDHSLLEILPKNNVGMIDSEAMFACFENTGVISPPEKVFNYNSIGPWLAAAILEHVYKKPYAELLEKLLFKPLGIKTTTMGKDINICPSIGQDLRLSAEDLIKIARLHLQGDSNRPKLLKHLLTLRTQFSFPAPEWLPAGERCYPGWFDFGGSFGQLGYGEDSAGVIRFLPEQEAAIVVTSTHQKLANATLATMFKDILKGFGELPLPRLLSTDEWAETDTTSYKGVFENAKYRLLIDTAANGSLRVKGYRKCNEEGVLDSEPYIKRYFKAAAKHFFMPTQPEQLLCPVLAFSHSDKNGQFQYLATSRYVFSRKDHLA